MELVNVQCESCHGLADKHMSSLEPVPTPTPTIDLCINCHTPDRCQTFREDASIEMGKIKHWQ